MQTAVFVDAGYLFAQGSILLSGAKVVRQRISLDPDAAASLFGALASAAAPSSRLLRIYWYDGLIRGGNQTAEHVALGRTPDVKLRLGMVNSRGEQKGVDSLIVTDLIELARNHAIGDAVILSGDEDIRIGLQVAQTFGVRVALVGIKPALGSQSPDLVAEADTLLELDEAVIRPLLSIADAAPTPGVIALQTVDGTSVDEAMQGVIREAVAGLDGNGRSEVLAYVDANRGALPGDIDRPTLARLRDSLGRDVGDDERRQFRKLLRSALRAG